MQGAYYTIGQFGVQRHWTLDMPYYTHATSPIRRYVDIVNQRMIMGDHVYSSGQLERLCLKANDEKRKTKLAYWTEQSLLERQWIMEHLTTPCEGIIVNITPKWINVYVPQLFRGISIHISDVAKSFGEKGLQCVADKDSTYFNCAWVGSHTNLKVFDPVTCSIDATKPVLSYKITSVSSFDLKSQG